MLGENSITDLSALTRLKKLKVLELNNNQLTDISALAKLKQLKELDLRNNPDLTKTKIEKLQKALPKCRIYHNAKERLPPARDGANEDCYKSSNSSMSLAVLS